MQTGNPIELHLVHEVAVPSTFVVKVERYTHKALQDFHVRGEWFECSDIEAVCAVNMAIAATGSPSMTPKQVAEVIRHRNQIYKSKRDVAVRKFFGEPWLDAGMAAF